MSHSQLEAAAGQRGDDTENNELLETIELPKKRSLLWSGTSQGSEDDMNSLILTTFSFFLNNK